MSTRTSPRKRPPAARRGTARGGAAARQQQRRRLLVRIGVVSAVALGVLFFIARSGGSGDGSSSDSSSGSGGPSFQVGRPGPGAAAPTFTLPSTAGGTFDLAAQRGKTVLLYFHEGVGCQPCWDQVRDIEKSWGQFRALGIDQLVAIAGNPLGQLRQKTADEKLETPVLADPELSLGATYEANQYGMMGTSTYGHSFVVVGPDGKVQWRADYGGSPDYTMYVKPPALLADLRAGLGPQPAGS